MVERTDAHQRHVVVRDCPNPSCAMELALELRDDVITAVCARNFSALPGLVQKLAKLSPTEDGLRGSGIGHLVGDRHIWGLAGYTTQRRAAALQARWRVAVRHAKASGTTTPKALAKPFGGLRAKEFLTLVGHSHGISDAIQLCGPPS